MCVLCSGTFHDILCGESERAQSNREKKSMRKKEACMGVGKERRTEEWRGAERAFPPLALSGDRERGKKRNKRDQSGGKKELELPPQQDVFFFFFFFARSHRYIADVSTLYSVLCTSKKVQCAPF